MNFSLGLRTASPKLLLGLGNTPLGQPNWEPKGGMGERVEGGVDFLQYSLQHIYRSHVPGCFGDPSLLMRQFTPNHRIKFLKLSSVLSLGIRAEIPFA